MANSTSPRRSPSGSFLPQRNILILSSKRKLKCPKANLTQVFCSEVISRRTRCSVIRQKWIPLAGTGLAVSTMRDAAVGLSPQTAITQSPKRKRKSPSLHFSNVPATASNAMSGTITASNAAAIISRSPSMASSRQTFMIAKTPRDTSHCSTTAKMVRYTAFVI